jgi:polysaccharide chain length determinant protein (PEP-CTERM system associated)
MSEDFEQESPESIDWNSYLGVMQRRAWYFLLPFFIVWLMVWIAGWFMPSVYRSSELIIVQGATVPNTLVPSNIAGNLQDRLDSITQQILSRTRLLHIIDQFNLYSKDRVRSSPDDLVARMQKDIEIELVRAPDQQLSNFRISYSSRDPYVAQEVTSELTNLFINENLEVRETQSGNTTKFLEEQLEQARAAQAAQEEKVRQFKQQHLGELPGEVQSNLQILSGLQSQLQNEQASLNSANEHNVYLQSLLGQYQALGQVGKTGAGQTLAPGSLPAIDAELERLRAQLTDLSSRYTDEYPDVRKVKDQIAKTERMRQQVQNDLKASAAKNTDASDGASYTSAKDAGPVLELQSQLKANQIEIHNRQQAIKNLEARISLYQAHLSDAPIREQQLAELNRGYEQSKADYDALFKKKNDSELAYNLERAQQGEHFSITDPANLPTKPYSPNRLKLFAMGLALGIVVGGACASGAEFLDHHIYSEAEFKKIVPAEVIAEIPTIFTAEEEQVVKRSSWFKMAGAGAVALSVFIALAITLLRG